MKSKSVGLLIAVILFASNGFGQKNNKLVGYEHKGVVYGATLPNGAKDLGGGLLSDADYGVTRFSKGKTFMLWLEKITARSEDGVPNWTVKDVLSFDQLKKNQEFLFSYSSGCTQNGKSDLNLIVLAETAPKSKKTKIIRVWKANTRRERFEKVSVRQIKCGAVQS